MTDVATPTGANPPVKQRLFALRRFVENFYDLQEQRIQTAGRTQPKAVGSEIVLYQEDLQRLERQAKSLEKAEKDALSDVKWSLDSISFYKDVLSDKVKYRGIGPTMAGVILSSFDIWREETPSQMWSFAGLAPIPCYRCKECQSPVDPVDEGNPSSGFKHFKPRVGESAIKCSKSKEIIKVTEAFESGKAAKPKAGEKLKYNKWLRTKLVGVLGPILLKSKSPWTEFYYNYKTRKASAGWGRNDGHRHQAAIRYMIKMLLLDIWVNWRTHEGLTVRKPYAEEKLGIVHHPKPEPKPEQAAEGDGDPQDHARIAAEMELLEDEAAA